MAHAPLIHFGKKLEKQIKPRVSQLPGATTVSILVHTLIREFSACTNVCVLFDTIKIRLGLCRLFLFYGFTFCFLQQTFYQKHFPILRHFNKPSFFRLSQLGLLGHSCCQSVFLYSANVCPGPRWARAWAGVTELNQTPCL